MFAAIISVRVNCNYGDDGWRACEGSKKKETKMKTLLSKPRSPFCSRTSDFLQEQINKLKQAASLFISFYSLIKHPQSDIKVILEWGGRGRKLRSERWFVEDAQQRWSLLILLILLILCSSPRFDVAECDERRRWSSPRAESARQAHFRAD